MIEFKNWNQPKINGCIFHDFSQVLLLSLGLKTLWICRLATKSAVVPVLYIYLWIESESTIYIKMDYFQRLFRFYSIFFGFFSVLRPLLEILWFNVTIFSVCFSVVVTCQKYLQKNRLQPYNFVSVCFFTTFLNFGKIREQRRFSSF